MKTQMMHNHPNEVLADRNLSREEKIKILEQMEYDALELQVAEEENMPGGPPDLLVAIKNALRGIRDAGAVTASGPTKQGG